MKKVLLAILAFTHLIATGVPSIEDSELQSSYISGTLSKPTSLSKVPFVLDSSQVQDLSTAASSTNSFAKALNRVKGEAPGGLRGAKEVQLYRKISPSVVLIVNESSIGSGSILNPNGDILTNWHVIEGAKEVGVIFKPIIEGAKITKTDVRRAVVVKFDEVTDLALIRLIESPKGVMPITFANLQNDVAVGADVHAIGHPSGESWTYTKGVVSQIRRDYKWTSESNKAHEATVIQTQTPINPGNSGGPLLTDEGKLVGVNSFKSKGEGLNFAVSIDDVQRFLSSSSSRFAQNVKPPTTQQAGAPINCPKEPKELYSGPNNDNTGSKVGYDIDCDGKVDMEVRIPNDKSKPISWAFDNNGDGKPDEIYFDYKRTNYFEFSVYDTDYDGKWDLVGHHSDGKMKAVRYEKYETYFAKK
jgi:S1-C subfamily serine protease